MARKSLHAVPDVEERRHIDCAHEGCRFSAVVRQKTPAGWANFCHPHYMEFHRRSAVEWCNAHGLDTREKQLKFIREKSGVVFKHMEAF